MSRSFAVVLPVKPPAVGKSRLDALGSELRAQLAVAFALDTVTAAVGARSVERVVVATDDQEISRVVADLGCLVVPDAGGLNEALVAAVAAVRRLLPHALPVALCADLPCLRPSDLDEALTRLPQLGAGFVADASGTGTTTYAAPFDLFQPRFGPDSRARHLEAGAVELAGAPARLRRDVDDPDDLVAARALGVGARTAAVLARLS
ncbi:MAG: 2-phospho-L-lactate guanylyltransferase [Nocardioidaceae bacterium]